MLELLKRWAELESEVVFVDVYDDLEFKRRGCKISVTLLDEFSDYERIGLNVEEDKYPVIEYAVRDAIDAREAHWKVGKAYDLDGDPVGYYANVYGFHAYADSPAEAILTAYLEYLEHINSQEEVEV